MLKEWYYALTEAAGLNEVIELFETLDMKEDLSERGMFFIGVVIEDTLNGFSGKSHNLYKFFKQTYNEINKLIITLENNNMVKNESGFKEYFELLFLLQIHNLTLEDVVVTYTLL